MQYFSREKNARARREKTLIALVILSLTLLAFTLLVTTNTTTNVSAVEANGVGVYWDNDCSDGVSSIDWGNLKPGSSKNVVVYIRNQKDEPIFLMMRTTNWYPSKASEYITLGWDYSVRRVDPDEALQVKLTLSVSRYTEGISSFSFDILITGSQNLPGDVDGDGVVGIGDVILVLLNWGPVPPKPPECDVNGDGTVDIGDLIVVFVNWS